MSKTVDDLAWIYLNAFAEEGGHDICAISKPDERTRAGIAAAVRALRDEIAPPSPQQTDDWEIKWPTEALTALFNNILGASGDEVADGPRSETMGSAPSATAPAPAVCEITAERDRLKAALEEIAVKAGTSECGGDYVAAVTVIGDIEQMADKALGGDE